MKHIYSSQKLLIEEVMQASQKAKTAIRGLSIGILIKYIRLQLGMSQRVLSHLAKIPQATISRIELGKRDMTLSTLSRILEAISCDLLIIPLLRDSVESILYKQAKKIAQKQVQYLIGTMHLEQQQPDPRFIEELLKREEKLLLQGPRAQLWEK